MEQGIITCPQCGHDFEISDALTGRIREHLKSEMYRDVLKREADVKKQEEKISKSREAMEKEIEKKLKERLPEAEKKASKKAEEKYTAMITDFKETVEDQEKKIADFRNNEIELRKKQRELEDSKKDLELAVARKLDEERGKIEDEAFKKFSEDHRLKDKEREKVINDLRASLEDMKRKAEQGSMETQGEVLEQDFEAKLKEYFIHDNIQPVPKGIRGADLIQTVCLPVGTECGVLLWETKNTKSWNSQWIPKLKDDMIKVRASIAILVSVALPPKLGRFGQIDGVWVCDPLSSIPLATVLREQLIALDRERAASVGKNEKMEALYGYLAGVEFKQKIEGIVEAFTSMQDQLNKERRAMERIWNKREKEINRVINNTAGLYGDMQGIIGRQIPTISALELDGDTIKQISDGNDK